MSTGSEPEASAAFSTRRPLHLGAWLAGGGAASLLLLACVAAAVAWIVIGVVPRFSSAPLSLPLQHTLWSSYGKPKATTAAGSPAELGVLVRPNVAGTIVGLRFYKVPGDNGPHAGSLWTAKGKRIAAVSFVNETDSGWQEALFAAPVPVEANRLLVASYFTNASGLMAVDPSVPEDDAPSASGSPVFRLPPANDRPATVYHLDEPGFPSTDAGGHAIWVDVVFVPATTNR